MKTKGTWKVEKKKNNETTNWTKEINRKPQFVSRMYGSLYLCLILVYLGPVVKGNFHTKSFKPGCQLNQQKDV